MTVKPPVKPLGATVVVAGTLATAGLLLDSETTAPLVAPTLMTTVPATAVPPSTEDGLTSIVDRDAGGGATWGVKLRTADHGTRQRRLEPVHPADPPEVGRGCKITRRVHRRGHALFPNQGLGERARVVDLDRVGHRLRHVVPVEGDRLRHRGRLGRRNQRRRARNAWRRRRRRGGGIDVDLRDEGVAPEYGQVAVEHMVVGADGRREILGIGQAGDVDVAVRVLGDVQAAVGLPATEEGAEQQRGPGGA